MPRSKANAGAPSHTRTRFELLLDEYIAASPGGVLPEPWGFSANSRRHHATFLAEFSQSPELLKPFPPDFFWGIDSQEDREKQILFAKLFASAPDYFLAFVAHFRGTSTARSQVERVARIILAEGDRLLVAPDGREYDDREIAVTLAPRKEFRLKELHPSVIGKARKLISDWCVQEDANRTARNLEARVLFQEWLEELRSINGVADSVSG